MQNSGGPAGSEFSEGDSKVSSTMMIEFNLSTASLSNDSDWLLVSACKPELSHQHYT